MRLFQDFILMSIIGGFGNYVDCQGDQRCREIQDHCQGLFRNYTTGYPNYKNLRTSQLIKKHGYPVEEHEVTTKDGYILTLFRIPFSKKSPHLEHRIPVFLMHGFMQSSAQWFGPEPDKNLADAGYDVWIGNSRGNSYSSKHVSLSSENPNDLRYWNFSVDELGKFDIPAVINFVTNHTKQPNLYYIGHSYGCEQFFATMILYPQLAPKVRMMVAMAPGPYLENSASPLFAFAPFSSLHSLSRFGNEFGNGKFPPGFVSNLVESISVVCYNALFICNLCRSLRGLISVCNDDMRNLLRATAYTDATSFKTFTHSSQNAAAATFRRYDYGAMVNMEMYGNTSPPDYDWSKFDVPVVVYYADEDKTIVPKDAKRTIKALGPNLKAVKKITGFNHFDFIISRDADIRLYDSILEIINSRKYDRVL